MVDSRVSFGFAFNDPHFSDRVLHVEIMADSFDSKSVSDLKQTGKSSEAETENDSESSTIVEVKTFHTSSPILAGYSPFFYKLFKNGMRESQRWDDVILRIKKSEEAAFTELLSFMYSNTLSATTTHDLLGLLIVADKFEVTSCMRYCSELLQKMPMSLESALLYLELPSSVLVAQVVQPLIVAAKKWLVEQYKDVNKFQDEAMAFPISAIEVVLDSGSLQVSSRDDVFEFILKWARAHYPSLEERREILSKRLRQFIRFQYMSCSKLKEVLICPDFDHEEVSNLVIEALFFKIELPYGYLQNIHASNNCQLLKVEPIKLPNPRCVVYFDLKKEECDGLPRPPGTLNSPLFCLDGRWFKLLARRNSDKDSDSFGLYVCMTEESEGCTLDFEFAVMKNSSKEFQTKTHAKIIDKANLRLGLGSRNLLGIPWTDFMGKDSEYFIDGILHLRADLTINNAEA